MCNQHCCKLFHILPNICKHNGRVVYFLVHVYSTQKHHKNDFPMLFRHASCFLARGMRCAQRDGAQRLGAVGQILGGRWWSTDAGTDQAQPDDYRLKVVFKDCAESVSNGFVRINTSCDITIGAHHRQSPQMVGKAVTPHNHVSAAANRQAGALPESGAYGNSSSVV